MRRHWFGFFFAISALVGLGAAQSLPTGDAQAVALAAQSVAALTGGIPVTDVTLNGTVTRIAGSDQQTGTVTLLAKGVSESRVDLNLSGGTRSEIRNSNAIPNEGNWIGPDGVVHAIALHNCFTDSSWFFPGLGALAAAANNSNIVLTNLGLESFQQTSVQHIHAYTNNSGFPPAQTLSAMDFYLDPQSLFPLIVTYDEHPDNDEGVNIPVALMFSDYRNVNGATIPFHIQRYVNNSLTLDIQLSSATINSGLSDSLFNIQ